MKSNALFALLLIMAGGARGAEIMSKTVMATGEKPAESPIDRNTGGGDTTWFDEGLFRCSFLVRPSPENLDGQYFLIARSNRLNEFGYVKTRQNLRQLKMMGVTDIIQLLIRGSSTYFPSGDKDAIYRYDIPGFNKEEKDYDALMVLVEAAAAEGIGVWCKLQLLGDRDGLELNKAFRAHRPDGSPYLNWANTAVPDVLNPDYRAFLKRMIDLFAGKYNRRGSFKGFYIDMPYANHADLMAGYLEEFRKFCEERFKETPPLKDIAESLKKDDIKWEEPNNKWWRRFILFKRWAREDFVKDLAAYCGSKGLKFGLQINTSVDAWRGWWEGEAPCAFSKYADWVWMYPGQNRYEPCYIMNRCIPGTFNRVSVARTLTESFRGQFAGVHVFFGSTIELPVLNGTSPRVLEQVKLNILNTREWANAKSLTKVAILYNHGGMSLKASPKEEERDEYLLMDRLSQYVDVDRVFTDLPDFFKRYNALLVTRHSTDGLPEAVMEKLTEFIRNGGTAITLGHVWSTAKIDREDMKDMTQEITGLPVRPAVGAGKLEIFEKPFGKGKVVTIRTPNIYQALKNRDEAFEKDFVALIQRNADAPVTIDNDSANPRDKRVAVMTTIKKNNWIGVSLFPNQDYPKVQEKVFVTVRVDTAKLGVNASRFRVLLLKRNMELLKEIINRADRSWSTPMPRGKGMDYYWSADDLKKGVKIVIDPDNEFDLAAPKKVDVPPAAKYEIKRLCQDFPRKWNQNAIERNYMYEIMVVAPADELNIAGEKIVEGETGAPKQ